MKFNNLCPDVRRRWNCKINRKNNNKLVSPCVWFRLPLYTLDVLVAVQETREFLRRSQGPWSDPCVAFSRTLRRSSRRGKSSRVPTDRQSRYRRRAVPCNLASFVCSTIASRDERRRYRCVCQCYDSTDNEKQFAQLPSEFLRLCWCAHQRCVSNK